MEKPTPPDGKAAESAAKSEGSPGLGMAGAPPPPPGEAAGTPGLQASASGALALRHRFVLGIFAGFAAARKALESFFSGGDRTCDVLVLSDLARNGGESPSGTCPPGRARCGGPACSPSCSHVQVHVDALGSLGPAVSEALAQSLPFASLAESLRDPDTGLRPTPAGTPRPFQNIVHHLAGGATVAIVRVTSSEQQLRASRAFLDAGCEVLLTHELMSPATS